MYSLLTTSLRQACLLLVSAALGILAYSPVVAQSKAGADDRMNFRGNAALPAPVGPASINKGGEAQVNLSSGVPNVQIPILDVKSRFINVPISLAYQSNGIKVNELASLVGLGWSLNCGGALNRTTLGLPDEQRSLYNSDFNNFTKTYFGQIDYATMNYLTLTRDRESDIFDYSVNGYINGKFILDSLGLPRSLETNNDKIRALSQNILDGFEVTSESGMKFLFTVQDTSQYIKSGEYCNFGQEDRNRKYMNAWHLSQIILPGQDTVYFDYDRMKYNYTTDVNEQESICISSQVGGCSNEVPTTSCSVNSSEFTRCITTQTVRGSLLKRIRFSNGEVRFAYVPRKDLSGGLALSSVQLVSEGNVIRTFGLRQDYAKTLDDFSAYHLQNQMIDSTFLYRLMLKGIDIQSTDAVSGDLHYNFSYNQPEQLPARLSASQDIYGYYNGQKDNRFLLTTIKDEYPDVKYYELGYPARYGNRNTDPTFMGYGVLTKVIYPTGGADSLVYEVNKRVKRVPVYRPGSAHLIHKGEGKRGNWTQVSTDFTLGRASGVNYYFAVINMTEPPKPVELIKNAARALIIDLSTGTEVFGTGGILMDPIREGSTSLPAGNYRLILMVEGEEISAHISLGYSGEMTYQDVETPIGLSISKIISLDEQNKTIQTKSYSYNSPDGKSSTFTMLDESRFIYFNSISVRTYCHNVTDCEGLGKCQFLIHGSDMVAPTSMLGSSTHYHRCVTENITDSQGNEMATEYKFAYIPLQFSGVELGAVIPGTSYGIYANMLVGDTSVTQYARNSTIKLNKIVKQTNKRYINDRTFLATNFNVSNKYRPECIGTNKPTLVEIDALNINSYPIIFQDSRLREVEEILYPTNGEAPIKVVTTSDFTGNGYFSLRQSKLTDSRGRENVTRFKYPFDVTNDPTLVKLKALNKLSPVASEYLLNQGFISRQTIEHKDLTSGVTVLPYKYIDQLKDNNPNVNAEITRFDNFGNILEVIKSGTASSFIYDYNNSYLTAAVTNSSNNDIAYSSFEADGNGGFTIASAQRQLNDAVTGKKSYLLNQGNIIKNGLTNTQSYTVSCWAKGGNVLVNGNAPKAGRTVNGWTYYETTLSNTISATVSGSAQIDELRLYPSNAQMTTYTYQPHVGVLNECGPGNKIATYEYDGQGRLKIIRDENRNILKQVNYQYQVPVGQ